MARPFARLVWFIMCVPLCAGLPQARGEAARHGTLGNWGSGNWGGSSFTVGRSTMYANGLVGRQMGQVTVYNNGLVAVEGRRATYFSNNAVGVPIRGMSGGMVYGGGQPYPYGPTPFGPAASPAQGGGRGR